MHLPAGADVLITLYLLYRRLMSGSIVERIIYEGLKSTVPIDSDKSDFHSGF